MPRLSFIVSEEVAEQVKRRADAAGLSVSRYVAEIMRREVDGGWPAGYFERLVGCLREDEIVRPEQPPMDERDSFDP